MAQPHRREDPALDTGPLAGDAYHMARRQSREPAAPASTVDDDEVARFAALAEEWWDPDGRMAVLHRFNPVRLDYIRDHLATQFDRDPRRTDSLSGLRLLDIGCGGGLLCEPLARLGAEVVGVDPSERNIATARIHAEAQGLAIDYRATTAESLAAAGERFDAVLAMEVVEHVADVEAFLKACGTMVRPGGLFFLATINRTLKAFALAIVGAEYVLNWLPRGTHQWNRFLTPDEIEDGLAAAGLRVLDLTGVVYAPLSGEWRRSRDTDVNYMLVSQKPERR
ncbi:3-demethylubiquinone-9 3-methyltransferase [Tepidamorphus gemmatus]|uniref:Ubiquinone biosynthesis O-methyltransferase n=2 Tax=Tepidamorphus gemmatus TaxID=747076 RepID=A0A4R3LYT8_9HYPH|nr:3-demethylubiquinone-9 3-methyltransferase [Tepidamorphus gemmatus]